MREGIIEQGAHRAVIFAHDTLHTIHGTDHMAFVDHFAAANTDKEIFRVICHADDLMRDDLSR